MQDILTQSIILITIASIVFLISDFLCSVRHTPQANAIAESPVTQASYATLDWVQPVVDIEVESVDVVAIAKSRMPKLSLASLGIRELKKLASQRKVKGYSKLNKAQLVAALC